MMSKIVIAFRFTFLQKLVILISMPIFLLLVFSYLIDIFVIDESFFWSFFIGLYPIFVLFAFLKKGFVVRENKLYQGYFFTGILVYKKMIETLNKPSLSVLKFKKSRKLPWFSAARPDLEKDYFSYEINILNHSHTSREIILELNREKQIRPTLDFLLLHTQLEYKPYNPQTRKRFKRR